MTIILLLPTFVATAGTQTPGLGEARDTAGSQTASSNVPPQTSQCPPTTSRPIAPQPQEKGVIPGLLDPLAQLLAPSPPKPEPSASGPSHTCTAPAPSQQPGAPPPQQSATSPMPPPSYTPPTPPGLVPQLLAPVTTLVFPPTEPTDPRPGPGRVWTLTASDLTLRGVRYDGYATQDVNGQPTTTLHFTVDSLEITDLVQRGWLNNGRNLKTAAAPGSVSTVTHGPIELYTLQLTGTLAVLGFPLVPLTLSPNTLLLPNVDLSFLKLPVLTFRNVAVRNVDLSGGNLQIPGARITLEQSGHYGEDQARTADDLYTDTHAPPQHIPPTR